jgi:glutathione S-transferase
MAAADPAGEEIPMLKIHGPAHSRAFRVIWLANEIGIPYEYAPAKIVAKDAQCLGFDPNGREHTIEDDGFLMWESTAIILYLADKYESSLLPSTPQARGRMLQWAFFVANDVDLPLITILRNRVFFPPEQRNATIGDHAEEMLGAKLGILEQQLAKTSYFGGDKWDLTDFLLASVLYILIRSRLKILLASYPKLDAWLNASVTRPGAQVARKLRESWSTC